MTQESAPAVAERLAAEPDDSLFSRGFLFGTFPQVVCQGRTRGSRYGLISGSNFLLGVLLARWLSPRSMGPMLYPLAFSPGWISLSVTFAGALSVFSAHIPREHSRLPENHLWLHWGLSFAMCLPLAMAAVAPLRWGILRRWRSLSRA